MTGGLDIQRGTWIAVAAVLAMLWASDEVSACSAMTESGAVCAPACGCCDTPSENGPTFQDVAPATRALSNAIEGPRTSTSCQAKPGGGCSCQASDPAAPSPKSARSTADGRAKPSTRLASTAPEQGMARFGLARPVWAPQQGPPRAPLYLRHERLLI